MFFSLSISREASFRFYHHEKKKEEKACIKISSLKKINRIRY